MRDKEDVIEDEEAISVPEPVVRYIHEKTGYPIDVIRRILWFERLYYGVRVVEE